MCKSQQYDYRLLQSHEFRRLIPSISESLKDKVNLEVMSLCNWRSENVAENYMNSSNTVLVNIFQVFKRWLKL